MNGAVTFGLNNQNSYTGEPTSTAHADDRAASGLGSGRSPFAAGGTLI